MQLKITVSHDRDESCNDYTLTRTIEVADVSDALVKHECITALQAWRDTYPHKGRHPHHPVVDAEIFGIPASMTQLAADYSWRGKAA